MTKRPRRAAVASADAGTILAQHTPEIQALVDEARSVVRAAAAQANEAARTGWHSLAFSHPDVGYFCGIFPRADYVEVILEWGVLLDDPHRLFTSRGGQVGAIRLMPGQAWDREALARLIDAALKLPGERALRVAMARERRS